MVERALQIAEAGVEDMSKYDRFLRSEAQFCEFRIRSKDIMENIFYFRICSLMELIELINHLEKFISKQGNVGILYFSVYENTSLFSLLLILFN